MADQSRAVKLRQKIEEFTLFDDELVSRVFDENIECLHLLPNAKLGFLCTGRLAAGESKNSVCPKWNFQV